MISKLGLVLRLEVLHLFLPRTRERIVTSVARGVGASEMSCVLSSAVRHWPFHFLLFACFFPLFLGNINREVLLFCELRRSRRSGCVLFFVWRVVVEVEEIDVIGCWVVLRWESGVVQE